MLIIINIYTIKVAACLVAEDNVASQQHIGKVYKYKCLGTTINDQKN